MSETLLADEPLIRLACFAGVFAVMALWEVAAPRRGGAMRTLRWPNNLGVVALDAALVRLAFPTAAVGLALAAEGNGWGLLNAVELPYWLAVAISVAALDLAIYFQHALFHAVPTLWRLHRMHHADLAFDVTTGLRFHPVEILLSMGIKLGMVAALGPPAVAVLIFEILLNATAMFNHGDVRLPAAVDRILRWFVVTPEMHRVHHSIHPEETNSNFGFNLPWWDRLFGTYRAQPRGGHEGMTIGIEQFRTARDLWLDRMLVQPLKGPASGYPINRKERDAPGNPQASIPHSLNQGAPDMNISRLMPAGAVVLALMATPAAAADEAAVDAMKEYMEFASYEAGIILPQQITKDIFQSVLFVDTRDAGQFAKETIPGAINIEWREVLGRLSEIPKGKKVVLFCNTGSLSAQAAFALRVAGRDNVVVLQTGLLGWKQNAAYKP